MHAWNGEAHQLIAWIAEERLSDKAKADVKELLGGASLSDAEVASWADEIRRERPKTASWHYVNIPVDADGYDPARDGKDGDNVVDAVERFTKILADRSAPREDRVEALKFLVHFVGDMHQPLHCADRNGDKGGNTRLVFFPGKRKAVSQQSVAEYGATLNERITERQAKAWAKGTPQEWAVESWRVAKEYVYADVPADGDPPKLSDEYLARAAPVWSMSRFRRRVCG